MYPEILAALEASWLGNAARHSPWLFTGANLLHVLGSALLVGAIAVFDLRVLAGRGAWETGRTAIPLAAAGLALQIPTGLVLLAVEARALGQNPAFLAKAGLVALGVANVALFHARFGGPRRGLPLPGAARLQAGVSLGAWVLALLAGRLIAYL
ncbi:hypothetical protein [Salinarimonas soli]|uniref:DUF2214 domain-containing protein n=1 Tax=Salinarimonas soli TaxID=1638099 RepID=A0A5B2VYW8_9HYPH|nr:hypothetical protein [Salinarimonas soli]KAA2244205.1 hypothetical protein F0L46_00725 [Salinarimonas soli]